MAEYRPPTRLPDQSSRLPRLTLPGQSMNAPGGGGIEGFLSQLPPSMAAGTPSYRAGVDQSQAAAGAGGPGDASLLIKQQTSELDLDPNQAAALEQHQVYAQGLQATQDQVNIRKNDLKLAENMLTATDPGVDKAVRKFMLQGLSSAAGVDPKGEYSQQIQKMILGMNPESLEALRSTFGGDIKTSPPGAIQEQIGAVFSGQMPVENIIANVKQHQQAAAEARAALTSEPGADLGAQDEPAVEAAEEALPAQAPPVDPSTREAIIQTAGLSDAPTAQTPATIAPSGEDIPEPTPPPDVPMPEPIAPEDLSAPSAAPTATAEGPLTETPPPPEPAPLPTTPAPTATAEGPLTEAPAKPAPDAGKVNVTPEMRAAAEQSGDKLLIDAIAKLDQRNAVIDSYTLHKKGLEAPPPGGSPSGAAFLPSTQTLPYKGTPPVVGKPAAAGPPTGDQSVTQGPESQVGVVPPPGVAFTETPAPTGEPGPSLWTQAKRKLLELDPPNPQTGVKASDIYKVEDDGKIVAKDPAADMPTKTAAGAITTESAPAGPKPSDPMPDTWIKDHNAHARQNQLPKTENLRHVDEKDRAPHEKELVPGAKGGLPSVNPDPAVRTTAGDIARAYPNFANTKEGADDLAKVRATRDPAFTGLATPAFNLIDLVNNRGGNQVIGGFGPVTKGNISQLVERSKALVGVDSKEFSDNMALYKGRAEGIANNIEGLDPKQRSDLAVAIQANAALMANGVLRAQNPDGKYSDADRRAAQEQVARGDAIPLHL